MTLPFFFNKPQQARSQETLERILDAAAQILETKNFETLTIAEVVKKAGTSVGAFYGRFKDKEALLQALDERFFIEFERSVNYLLESPDWRAEPLPIIVTGICSLLVETYSQQKGVLRSLNLKGRLDFEPQFMEREQRAWRVLFPRVQEIVLNHRDKIHHPDPRLAIRFGFQQMFYGMREILLWEPYREEDLYDKAVLVNELTRAFLAYLEIKEVNG